jgi:hypothetical protein
MDITLPANTVANIGANTSDLLGGFSPIITLILGILVAVFIIDYMINTVEERRYEAGGLLNHGTHKYPAETLAKLPERDRVALHHFQDYERSG